MKANALVYGTVGMVIFAVVIGVTATMARSYLQKQPTTRLAACDHTGVAHTVIIQNSQVYPPHTDLKLCDKLTIVNRDNVLRIIAFGQHTHHQMYDGTEENQLLQNQAFTITANKTGTYEFHDHLHDEVYGDFTVN